MGNLIDEIHKEINSYLHTKEKISLGSIDRVANTYLLEVILACLLKWHKTDLKEMLQSIKEDM